MPGQCVIGLQWGDEAKGKLVDLLTQDKEIVVRYQGGANAGHTVVVGDEKYVLHPYDRHFNTRATRRIAEAVAALIRDLEPR